MKFPIRKDIRLKDFDYSQDGIYFITICSENRKNIFSKIKIKQDLESATAELTEIGLIAEKHIGLLEQRYNFIEIIAHTIMPNHIHLLISVLNETDKKEKISNIIRAYKSLVSTDCAKLLNKRNIFQRSYFDHVIRNEKDLYNTISYIEHNPGKWIYDKYYSDGTIAT